MVENILLVTYYSPHCNSTYLKYLILFLLGAGVGVTLEQTKCFLKSSLDNFSSFQETVRNMQPFMQELVRLSFLLYMLYVQLFFL